MLVTLDWEIKQHFFKECKDANEIKRLWYASDLAKGPISEKNFGGACAFMCVALSIALRKYGIHTKLNEVELKRCDHAFLTWEDMVIDPTINQFDSNEKVFLYVGKPKRFIHTTTSNREHNTPTIAEVIKVWESGNVPNFEFITKGLDIVKNRCDNQFISQ